jgi:UDP-4-amino-4,6-dideoxy-N-acetyl-beta-L-altrosamine transaminase
MKEMTLKTILPYGRQFVDEDDIAAVTDVLRGDWLTTGPAIEKFEKALSAVVDAQHAVVCSSGTAALYLAARAAGLQPGDAVIVPAITFAASASAAVLAGFEVVFADVDAETGLMSVDHAAEALLRGGKRVKAVMPVHLGGRVSDPAALQYFADDHGLVVIEDACHALGTRYCRGAYRIGGCRHSLAACFSFHPVKTITMGEGGAITTNSAALASHARCLRSHGITQNPQNFSNRALAFAADGAVNPWYYEIAEISHNFRAADINCALGSSQLRKLPKFLARRQSLWGRYQRLLSSSVPSIKLIAPAAGTEPGWHLCSILINFDALGIGRHTLMQRLKQHGVTTQVHYIPLHEQPFYRQRCGTVELPGASTYYAKALTLPLYPGMADTDVDRIVDALAASISA